MADFRNIRSIFIFDLRVCTQQVPYDEKLALAPSEKFLLLRSDSKKLATWVERAVRNIASN